ncbi:MAG: HD domain-containing protein [Thermoplasmatota archaeon]
MSLTPPDVSFALRALALKDVARAGWKRVAGIAGGELRQVARVESVADHAWGVAFLALVAAERDPSLDRGKLLSLALAHDLAEVVAGDLTPRDVASDAEKHARESAGLDELLASADAAIATHLRALWEEYETGQSREARLIRDLDKLEMALQARRYRDAGADGTALGEFVESARARIKDDALRALLYRLSP